AGSRPVRNLVAVVARSLELATAGVELVPLQVGLDLRHPAFAPPAIEERALLEREAVSRDVVRPQRDRAAKCVQPRVEVLIWHRVDEVDADVGHSHLTGQAK